MNSDKHLYLIDGYGLAYRAYFAMIRNPLTNSKGLPTSAVFGFTNYLLRILQDDQCTYCAVVFDSPKPSFRKQLYSEYKANRAKMPEDLSIQIPYLYKMVECLNVPSIVKDGYEADDILASITRRAEREGFLVSLITKDKDLMQLVSEKVQILAPETGGTFTKMGPKEVNEKMGVPPERIGDLLALMGDSSDNIPGIPGIGPKTALKILQKAETVENLIKDLSVIDNAKLRTKIETNIDSLHLSTKLVTLCCDSCDDIDLSTLKRENVRVESCIQLFQEMEFNSFLKNPLFDTTKKTDCAVHVIDSLSTLAALVEKIEEVGIVSIDTETTSLQPRGADIVGISIAVTDTQAWYVPLGHHDGNTVPLDKALSLLKPMIESETVKKIGQNLKYDYQVFKNYSIIMRGIYFDTLVAAYLIDPGRRQYSLDALAAQWLNIRTIPIESLIGKKGVNQKSFAEVSVDDAATYAGEDAVIPLQLMKLLLPILQERDLVTLFEKIEMPLITVLAEMEWYGILVDGKLLKELSLEYGEQLTKISNEVYALAGEEFNLNSPKQISEIFFNKLGLPKSKRTKTGLSTDVNALEKLSIQYPIARKLLDYREVQKLLSTYIDSLPNQVHSRTGRVHTSFNQTITATGRLSSNDPNLQNIPIRTENGKRIREAFIAPENSLLVCADYSQIELRILAHLSGDTHLIEAFQNDQDIHTQTASAVYGVFPELVTSEMRRTAKTINFGLMYGMGPINLSRQLGISFREAESFIAIYFKQFPTIQRFMNECIEKARTNGYSETLMGRRRYLPDITAENRRVREAAERTAINTPVQGTAADIIKIAMITIDEHIKSAFPEAVMLLQVHDELVFEVPRNSVTAFKQWVAEKMNNAYPLSVPLKVDVGEGENWCTAH